MNNYDSSLPAKVRKEKGVFYSPEMIAQYIVNEALTSFLAGKADQADTLQHIRILDPVWGGRFFAGEFGGIIGALCYYLAYL
jgi:hypothetical protein